MDVRGIPPRGRGIAAELISDRAGGTVAECSAIGAAASYGPVIAKLLENVQLDGIRGK